MENNNIDLPNEAKDSNYSETIIPLEPKPKKEWKKFMVGLLGIIIVVNIGYLAWDRYLSPQAKVDRGNEESLKLYTASQEAYEKAMAADTYGGKTPQATLNLFIDALKKEDVDLASKYFSLRDDGTPDPLYLENLKKYKDKGDLKSLVLLIQSAYPLKEKPDRYQGFEYAVLNKDGIVDRSIILRLNNFSSIWKIESF